MENCMHNETVSVIIPVYNVEPYLNRCVESVLRQSYHALEVLLVDDGSTDQSGMLCDQWAEKDSRIRVYHLENRGVSEARNSGIAAAAGDYIVFVDSDDFIDADMISKLFNALKKNHAEMSICNFLYVDEHGAPIKQMNTNLPVKDEVLAGTDIIKKFPDHNGWHFQHAWNKLYKTCLFSDIRFPKGKICGEDAFIAHRLLGKCSRIACISDACYYYVQRTDSVMHNEKSCAYYLHETEAYLDRALYSYRLGLYRCSGNSFWRAAMSLPDAWHMRYNCYELQDELLMALHLYRSLFLRLRKGYTQKERVQTILVFLSPGLYYMVFRNSFRKRLVKFFKNVRKV